MLYARVSTQRQAEKELPISGQLRALRAYAAEKDWEIVDEYVDKARSGRVAHRAELERLAADMPRLGFDGIFVWKLDRLARNMGINTTFDALCDKYGVRLISLHEPIDDTAQGKLTARIFESFAEFYSNNLSQDIQRGKREAARMGYYPLGLPPIGYKKEPADDRTGRKKLVLDETYAPLVRRVFEEYASGMTVPQVLDRMNEEGLRTRSGARWTKQRLYSILRNSVYCGDITVGKYYVDVDNKLHPGKNPVTISDVHPPLVSRSVYDKVQALLGDRSANVQRRQWDVSPYLLSGVAYCGHCGRHLVGTSAKGGRYHYYACQKNLKEGREGCRGVRLAKVKLERFVLLRLRDVILREEHVRSLVEMVNEELGHLGADLAARLELADANARKIDQRLRHLYEALETRVLELRDLAPRIRELREQQVAAERARSDLRFRMQDVPRMVVDPATVLSYVRDLRRTLARGSLQEQKQVIAGLVKRVTADCEVVEIEYTLPQPEPALISGVLNAVTGCGA